MPRDTPLNRAHVLDRAIALADDEHLDAVSMRRLAHELGVVPMALYKHVADKEDLLGGMIDRVIEGYEAPPPGEPWRLTVRHRALAARAAVLEHPWMRTALERATMRTPTVLAYLNTVAGDFIEGGFSHDLTHYAMHALGHRVWGFSPEAFSGSASSAAAEITEARPDPEQLAALARAYPHIAAISLDAAQRNASGACDEEREFAFSLDLLLAAFESLHREGWVSRQLTPPQR